MLLIGESELDARKKNDGGIAIPASDSAPEMPFDGLPPEEIRRQLERILNSDTFQRAERLSRFFRHVVEQALAGEEETLKEYAIGLSVFDKPDSFDTRVDPIVRVEAGRLRAKIRDYYEGEGRSDAILLGLRKRGYRPVFQRAHAEALSAAGAAPALQVAPIAAPVIRAAELPRPAAPPPSIRAIAVLPFEDLSPERTQEYFCDGITQEIINALAKVKGLSVAARTSAAQYKGKPEDVREIGRQLQVGRILEGSVQKIGQRVRISAHLVEGSTGFDCWAETYDRPLEDVLAIQDDVSQAIAEALKNEIEGASAASSVNPLEASKAHNHYIKALYHWDKRTEEEIKRAIGYFRKAVREDHQYAPAYAGLAASYVALALSEVLPPRVALTQAGASARQAMAINDRLAEAHAALGTVYALDERDWVRAEQAFRTAMELDPGLAIPHHWLAILCLMPQGRMDEAYESLQLALERERTSVAMNTNLGLLLFMRREYERAINQFQFTVDLEPESYRARWGLGVAYAQNCKLEEACEAFSSITDSSGGRVFRLSGLGYCSARGDDPKNAREVLNELEALSLTTYVSPYNFVPIYAALGERDAAIEWLQRASEDRSVRFNWIKIDPLLDSLRDDARLESMLEQIGLHEGVRAAGAV